ncbi:hypothetical protein NOVOSPHI9U_520010 [Novosphingobium sp. 9U]|nr:hypothetical protein NOVOSPHI9U_520010 [Novosphingobium sp. 9U]
MELSHDNVTTAGAGTRTMMSVHGFGCDQNMWSEVASAFAAEFSTVLFDHVRTGGPTCPPTISPSMAA